MSKFIMVCFVICSLATPAFAAVLSQKTGENTFEFVLLADSAHALAASFGKYKFQSNGDIQSISCPSIGRCELILRARALTSYAQQQEEAKASAQLGETFYTLFPDMTADEQILISQTDDGVDNDISRDLYNHLPGKVYDTSIDYGKGSVYHGTARALDLTEVGFFLKCEHTTTATGATVVGYSCVVNALAPIK
jgi:hypothetical protein